MDADNREDGQPVPRIRIGMTFNEVCAVLGPPLGTTSGSEMLGGKGKVTGVFSDPYGMVETRSKLFSKKYCLWQRPEGDYELVFEHERLTTITRAPDRAVMDPDATENALPARFVWLVTDGGGESPQDVLNTMLRDGSLKVHSDALVFGDVNSEVAVDLPTHSILIQGVVRGLKAVALGGKKEDFLDVDSAKVTRFRKVRGPGSAGILVTISGPKDDPDSLARMEVQRPRQEEVCAKCGITRNERLRQWNAPLAPKMVRVGDERGAFMYCEECKAGICGRCSIDLGITAGCPLCESELVYMDGEKQ